MVTNSDTSTVNIVQPKTTYNYVLDTDRQIFFNLRLNNPGRKIIARIHNDNHHLLLTQFGFNWGRNLGAVNVQTDKNDKHYTNIDETRMVSFAREQFYRLVDLKLYPNEVAKYYANPQDISWRSKYTAKKYFERLNTYGKNRDVRISAEFANRFISALDKQMMAWATNGMFNFRFDEFLSTGKWLSHIKTNSNSGYPYNIHQTKELMAKYAPMAVKLYDDYVNGRTINWKKLPFEMGFRTERRDNHRVICMAPTMEKLFSATVATFIDLTYMDLPFNLPRKYGGSEEIAQAFYSTHAANVVTKDFEAYDTSIPIDLIRICRDWFKARNNTLCNIIAFELDLIINSYMVIGPNLLFWIASLPSGIGITQFIGSLIHWALDICVQLIYELVMYQSDDNMGTTELTEKEYQECLDIIKIETGITSSPVGKKSSYSPRIGKFLQKVIDRELKISYNQEQRAFTNGIFRERELSDDSVFELVFGEAEQKTEKKQVLAYLGNLVSYGRQAPGLPNIFSFMFNKQNSGFTIKQIEWGQKNLEKYMEVYLFQEEHRPKVTTGWLDGFISKTLATEGWGQPISPTKIASVLSTI